MSSPQRHPVQPAVMISRPAVSIPADGVGGDEPFVDGVGEDHRQNFDDGGDGGVGVAELAQVADPLVHAEGGDRVERVAPHRSRM